MAWRNKGKRVSFSVRIPVEMDEAIEGMTNEDDTKNDIIVRLLRQALKCKEKVNAK